MRSEPGGWRWSGAPTDRLEASAGSGTPGAPSRRRPRNRGTAVGARTPGRRPRGTNRPDPPGSPLGKASAGSLIRTLPSSPLRRPSASGPAARRSGRQGFPPKRQPRRSGPRLDVLAPVGARGSTMGGSARGRRKGTAGRWSPSPGRRPGRKPKTHRTSAWVPAKPAPQPPGETAGGSLCHKPFGVHRYRNIRKKAFSGLEVARPWSGARAGGPCPGRALI